MMFRWGRLGMLTLFEQDLATQSSFEIRIVSAHEVHARHCMVCHLGPRTNPMFSGWFLKHVWWYAIRVTKFGYQHGVRTEPFFISISPNTSLQHRFKVSASWVGNIAAGFGGGGGVVVFSLRRQTGVGKWNMNSSDQNNFALKYSLSMRSRVIYKDECVTIASILKAQPEMGIWAKKKKGKAFASPSYDEKGKVRISENHGLRWCTFVQLPWRTDPRCRL
jgi:hypothetical protein